MRIVIKTMLCVSLVCCEANAAAGDAAAEQRRSELTAVVRELNAPATPDSFRDHPGWYNAELRTRLKSLAEKYPNTEEAVTAEMWLATAELEVGQTVADRSKRRENMAALAAAFSRVTDASPHSWQAKAAGIGKTAALLGAAQWDELRVQVAQVLDSIGEYKNESHPDYLAFLQAYKMNSSDIEPEIRWMQLLATRCEGKTAEAIAIAEDLQAKFPEFSARRKIAGTIELLKSGKKSTAGCP